MSDRICIMRDGDLVQSGSPRELYDQPTNLYVADFVGKTNFIAGSVTNVNGRSVTIESENGRAFVGCPSASAAGLSVGASASIAIRPELIVMSAHNTNATDMATDVALNGRIKNRIFLGEHWRKGSPRELYDQPTNLYVADFVGKTNFIAGSVTNVNGRSVTIESENGRAFVGCPSARLHLHSRHP